MISRKERIASMVFLTTPLPENIDEDCEDCQHWIENHTVMYESYTPNDIASRIQLLVIVSHARILQLATPQKEKNRYEP